MKLQKNYGILVESEKSNVIANSICKAAAANLSENRGCWFGWQPKKAKEEIKQES